MIDHMAMEQAVGLWGGRYRGVDYPAPRFCWVSFQLTDCGIHAGGPRSEIAEAAIADTDGRIGEILAAVERAGAFDDTAFVLVADHGMEETNPEVRGDWDAALAAAGVAFRDEGHGFVYLDPALAASARRLHPVPGGPQGSEHLGPVGRVAGLECHVDLDLVDGQVDAAAVVLDVDDVEAEAGQRPRSGGAAPPAGRGGRRAG